MKLINKVFPFFVLMLITIFSCHHDDALPIDEQAKVKEPQFIIKMESGEHFRDINPDIYQRLVENARHLSSLSESDNTSTPSLSLDLSRIQIIERNTYIQYTTSVIDHPDYESFLINYLLFVFDDGAQYQLIVKYPRTINEQGSGFDYANAIMESITGDILLQSENTPPNCLNGSVPELVSTSEQYSCTETPCTGNARHEWGDECPCNNLSYCTMPTRECGWETTYTWSCTGGGTVDGGSGDGTAGGSSNDPNDDNPDDPIETVPFVPYWERVVDCVNNGALGTFDNSLPLTSDDIMWLQSQAGTVHANAISDYIDSNGCNLNRTFLDEAIEAIRNGSEVDFDNELILDQSFVNDAKLKCVYDKLKTSNSTLFKKTIGNFINNPKLKITIKKGNCVNTNDACCDDLSFATTGVVNIIIEDTGGSVLDIASMILHEAIHAEITRYVLLNAPSENPNDKPRILQLYKHYRNLYDEGDIEHIFMTERYINPIASALRKLDNNSYPIDYYKAYAWDGLRAWDANNLLSMQEDQNFSNYRTIVEANTSLSCN